MKITKIALIAFAAASFGLSENADNFIIDDIGNNSNLLEECLDCLSNNAKKSECKEPCETAAKKPDNKPGNKPGDNENDVIYVERSRY